MNSVNSCEHFSNWIPLSFTQLFSTSKTIHTVHYYSLLFTKIKYSIDVYWKLKNRQWIVRKITKKLFTNCSLNISLSVNLLWMSAMIEYKTKETIFIFLSWRKTMKLFRMWVIGMYKNILLLKYDMIKCKTKENIPRSASNLNFFLEGKRCIVGV